MTSKVLQAALWYAKNGYSIIPVKRDKRPLLAWERYIDERADDDQIRQWWSKWPEAQIAIVCGRISGITVVDADSEESFKNIQENFIPDSLSIPTVKTSKGYHLYFSHCPDISNSTRFFEQCDIKNDRGYVLAPPSKNQNGDYKFLPGLHISKVPLPKIPEVLVDTIRQSALPFSLSNNNRYNPLDNTSNIYNKLQTPCQVTDVTRSNRNNSGILVEGTRDETIFSLAWHLIKGGMPIDKVREYIYFFADNSKPPFPRAEAEAKLNSAAKRREIKDATSTDAISEWVKVTDGNFKVTDYYLEATVVTPEDKAKVRAIFRRLVERGMIENVGKWKGTYRKVDDSIECIDFINCKTEKCDVWLPFGLNELVTIQPGNVIIVSGTPDAGKTGVMLNMIKNNMNNYEVSYFSSEMGGSELKSRLLQFKDLDLADWNFKAYGYKPDYSDFIKGGYGKIYFIDYLEILTDFYLVGEMINKIFRKLDGAIAVIALQQKKGSDLPKGGQAALEKARLAFSVKFQEVEITKAKNKKIDKHIIGWKKQFKLHGGAEIFETSEWM